MDRWPINPRRVAVFAGILVLILMVMDFNARLEQLNVLRRQASIINAQATQAVQTQIVLQTEVAFASSDDVVHEWARSEGHYVQPGDQAVVPVGVPGATPGVPESPTPQPAPLPNWQVWWNLFFAQQ
jgi:cell division protein FtsB